MATGDLCHVFDGNALAHKYGGNALIYKSAWDQGKDIFLFMTFSPRYWVCDTYHETHDGLVDLATMWDSRRYAVRGSLQLQIPAIYIPLAVGNVLQFTMSAHDLCAAHEDPHVTCAVTATQGEIILLNQTIVCPLGIQNAAVIANINLSGGIIQSITSEAAP